MLLVGPFSLVNAVFEYFFIFAVFILFKVLRVDGKLLISEILSWAALSRERDFNGMGSLNLKGLLLDSGDLLLSACNCAALVAQLILLESVLVALELEKVSFVAKSGLGAGGSLLWLRDKVRNWHLLSEVLIVNKRHLLPLELRRHELHLRYHLHVLSHGASVGVIHILTIKSGQISRIRTAGFHYTIMRF